LKKKKVMKKILNSLKYATLLSFSVFLLATLAVITFSNTNLLNHKAILVYSFLILLTPSFIALQFYNKSFLSNKKSSILIVFKSVLVSFFSMYFIGYFFMKYALNKPVPFFQKASFFQGIVAVFISIFILFLWHLFSNRKQKEKTKGRLISFKEITIIFLTITLIYYFLFYLLGGHQYLLTLIPVGVFATIISYFPNQLTALSKKIAIIFIYIFNISLFPLLTIYTHNPSINTRNLLHSIVIFAPYFLFLSLTIHLYQFYLSNKQEKEILTQHSLQNSIKYQQLKSQLSPHFLFNNISVLTSLIEENPKKAVLFSENLSDIYRHFLTNEKEDVLELDNELNFAKKYIELLQYRYENTITFSFPKNTYKQTYLPTHILQQVLENIVKHNEISNKSPINIDISLDDDYLTIKNNINPKYTKTISNKTGIKNSQERYSFFTDHKIIIEHTKSQYLIKLPLLNI